MKNYYYTTELATEIKTLLDTNLSSNIRNINIGNLSLLPPAHEIKHYLPAVFIEPLQVDSESANATLDIECEQYPFSIVYVSPYSFENPENTLVKIKEAEIIANLLRSDDSFKSFRIEKSQEEAGGMVVHRRVNRLKFDNIATELFAQLKVPACVVEIEFDVFFRTFTK